MIIKEIKAKAILSKSQIYDYTLNPYVGCQHACVYCYAKFMKRFTGHREPWGEFVDVKTNAAELLEREVRKKKKGRVWISGVCDAYQQIEAKRKLTRRCLAILVESGWQFTIQTKSSLVLRDLDLLKKAPDCEVGFTITTADDKIRKFFEPHAPPVATRIEALGRLREANIKTFAMIAPLLPGAEPLPRLLKGKVDSVLLDRLNYHYADWLYKKQGMEWAMNEMFFRQKGEELRVAFEEAGIPCDKLF